MASAVYPLSIAILSLAAALAQTPASRSFIGTVTNIDSATAELQVKTDAGESKQVQLTADTAVQKIAPGEKDLKKAEPFAIAGVHTGDRVLISLLPEVTIARRVIVMSAEDLSKRNDAEREDWNRRGVAGVVVSKKGNEITLRKRSFQGAVETIVVATASTQVRRYAPDSVRFADAKPSTVAAIQVGDQLRARGPKSEDGKLTAEEIVFGTFQISAGSITEVNAASGQVTISDLTTRKPLIVKLSGDSQLKRIPGGPPMAGGPRPEGAPGRFGGPNGSRPGGPPDLSLMFDRMPAVKVEELHAGEQIVVSSTKGARPGEVTAILMLANADMLIRMATAQPGGSSREPGTPSLGAGPSMGMGAGLNGLDLGGMIP